MARPASGPPGSGPVSYVANLSFAPQSMGVCRFLLNATETRVTIWQQNSLILDIEVYQYNSRNDIMRYSCLALNICIILESRTILFSTSILIIHPESSPITRICKHQAQELQWAVEKVGKHSDRHEASHSSLIKQCSCSCTAAHMRWSPRLLRRAW